MSERFVVLGVARARTPWFAEVARWCTNGTLPAHFVKCVSVEEVRARLASGRRYSVLVVDAGLPQFDRDLVASAADRGCPVVAVAHAETLLDVDELGLAGRLPIDFGRADLLALLAQCATLVPDTRSLPGDPCTEPAPAPAPWMGKLVAVCGTGGTGASTVAIAIAQALGRDPRHGGLVALADLALDADQAMLHGTDDVVPGLPELVDANRRGVPDAASVLDLTFDVPDRRYRLLLGLRRHRDWAALRPAAVRATVVSLRRSFQVVVADVDADVEGERECGALEVEDRNLLARTTVDLADVVVVVAAPGLKGVHSLVRTVAALEGHGVDPTRIVPVVNRSPRRVATRAEQVRAVTELAPPLACPPVFVPERSGIDEAHRDVAPLPVALCGPLSSAVRLALDRPTHVDATPTGPVRVRGGIGSWTEQDAASS